MSESNQSHLVKRMKWAARAIALATIGLSASIFIGEAIAAVFREGLEVLVEPMQVEVVTLIMIGAIALAGSILSWHRERLAGVLLILAAVGLGIHIGIFAGRNHLLAWSILGLPYLVAAILLLTSRQLSIKTS